MSYEILDMLSHFFLKPGLRFSVPRSSAANRNPFVNGPVTLALIFYHTAVKKKCLDHASAEDSNGFKESLLILDRELVRWP